MAIMTSSGHQTLVLRTLLGKAIRDRAGLTAVLGGLVVAMGLFVGALWPSLADTLAELQRSLPPAFESFLAGADMSTPSGWVKAELMSMVAPGATIAVAVVSAVRATAGEEEDGTLGLLLSAPVSRRDFLLMKAVAMVVHTATVSMAIVVGLVLGNLVGGMELDAAGLLAAGLHAGVLGVFFGVVALAVAAASGRRRLAAAVASGVAGLAFATSSFLPASDVLAEGARLSPWYYYATGDPVGGGPQWSHLLVLLVLTAIVGAVMLPPFRRRDLRG